MSKQEVSRRMLLKSGVAVAGLGLTPHLFGRGLRGATGRSGHSLARPTGREPGARGCRDTCSSGRSWIPGSRPTASFSHVSHFGQPALDADDWRLEISGLVDQPMTLDARGPQGAGAARGRLLPSSARVTTGLPFLIGAVGNARWTGTPLASLLEEAGVQEDGIEVVFLGQRRRRDRGARHTDGGQLRAQHVARGRDEPG